MSGSNAILRCLYNEIDSESSALNDNQYSARHPDPVSGPLYSLKVKTVSPLPILLNSLSSFDWFHFFSVITIQVVQRIAWILQAFTEGESANDRLPLVSVQHRGK